MSVGSSSRPPARCPMATRPPFRWWTGGSASQSTQPTHRPSSKHIARSGSGCSLVISDAGAAVADSSPGAAVAAAIRSITDPEIPVITLDDLGVIRDVEVDEGRGCRDR